CFFSWIMKGFFDGIDPSMEYAAMIDGCSRWGAFWRVAMPTAAPGLTALAILCWLYTWNEFPFALILPSHGPPILPVAVAQIAPRRAPGPPPGGSDGGRRAWPLYRGQSDGLPVRRAAVKP